MVLKRGDNMNIGDRIRQKRIELGLTQEELAKKLGYASRSSVNKMEVARDLPLKKVTAMANALDVTPSYLMGWEIKDDSAESKSKRNKQLADRIMAYIELLNLDGKEEAIERVKELTFNPRYSLNENQLLNAAHERTDIEVTDEMRKHDDDIMDDEDF
jgi:transcriptional regulator with XRE-family HTH domain